MIYRISFEVESNLKQKYLEEEIKNSLNLIVENTYIINDSLEVVGK